MRTTYEVAYGILDSLCCMGVKHVIMITSHADPQHQIAVEKAVRRINRKYGYQKYSDYFLYKILPLHLGFFGKVKRKKVTG